MSSRLAGIDPRLYFITDSILCAQAGRSVAETAAAAVAGGAGVVQIRDKKLSDEKFYALSRAVMNAVKTELTQSNRRVPIVLNDRVAVAKQLLRENEDVHIHVGQTDTPPYEVREAVGTAPLIGLSVANTSELTAAKTSQSVDWLGVGPVFNTATKIDAPPELGVAGVKNLVRETNLPTVAIGGIDAKRAELLRGSGINGVCVVSAICLATDPQTMAHHIYSIFA